jgi:hypothetical protein
MNGTYGRYTKNTMDNNGIPHLFVPTCHCLFMHSPLCAADVPWSFVFVRFLSVDDPPANMLENTPRVELAMTPSIMYSPLCPFLDAFCTLFIYPSMFFFPICQHLFEVTDLTTRGFSFFFFLFFFAIPIARRSLYVIKAL